LAPEFLKITEEAQMFGLLVSTEKRYVLILRKNGFGYVLGSIFKNSSSHPAHEPLFWQEK
jgi:hypothetical protein